MHPHKIFALTVFAACVLAAGHISADDNGGKPDLAELRGTWTLVSYRVDGVMLRGEDPASTFTAEEDRWTSKWRKDGGNQIEQGEVRIVDAKGKPKVADLVHTFGAYKGTTTRVFYRVQGDTLWYTSAVESGGKVVASTLTWKRKSTGK